MFLYQVNSNFILFAEDSIQAYDSVTLVFNLKCKYNHEDPGKEEKYCGIGPVDPSSFQIGNILGAQTLLLKLTQMLKSPHFDSIIRRKHNILSTLKNRSTKQYILGFYVQMLMLIPKIHLYLV